MLNVVALFDGNSKLACGGETVNLPPPLEAARPSAPRGLVGIVGIADVGAAVRPTAAGGNGGSVTFILLRGGGSNG